MRIILDTSVALGFVFEAESNTYTERVLDFLSKENNAAFVPTLFLYEISNVLHIGATKRKRWTQQKSIEMLKNISQLNIRVENSSEDFKDVQNIITLAAKHDLSAYDAVYLDLALNLKLPLATQDKNLKKAALSELVFFEG